MRWKFVGTAAHITACEQMWLRRLRGMNRRFKTRSSMRVLFARRDLRKILDELKHTGLLNCFGAIKTKDNTTVAGR
jgi:hypothetical protein